MALLTSLLTLPAYVQETFLEHRQALVQFSKYLEAAGAAARDQMAAAVRVCRQKTCQYNREQSVLQLAIRPVKLSYSGVEVEMHLVTRAILALLLSIETAELKVGLAPTTSNMKFLQKALDKLHRGDKDGDGDESDM